MLDILLRIPGKKKTSTNGWTSFNAVCCHHNGEKPDRRGRGGLIKHQGGGFTYSCFNCGYKTTYKPGRAFSHKLRKLLEWTGMSKEEIDHENLESLKQRDILEILLEDKPLREITFKEQTLPEGAVTIDPADDLHFPYAEYCRRRGVDAARLYITPKDTGRNALRVIVPFYYNNKLVGHTSRYLDDRAPKFISSQQPGYVFNTDVVKITDQFVIVCEGVFDALAIDGIALLHNDINKDQLDIITQLNKEVILVPDQDEPGLKLAERFAAEHGFSVSIPDWAPSIKDINDAVNAYGKFATLLSILRSRERSKIKIELRRREIGKRLQQLSA